MPWGPKGRRQAAAIFFFPFVAFPVAFQPQQMQRIQLVSPQMPIGYVQTTKIGAWFDYKPTKIHSILPKEECN